LIRRFLRHVWGLPWPRGIRLLASTAVTLPGLRLLFIPHFTVGVVGLIFDGDGRLLLLEHTYRAQYPWGLPTGFVEHGEQPRDALEREMREETGFTVNLSTSPFVYVSDSPPILNVLYRGTFVAGHFEPGAEISAARFFARKESPPLNPEQAALLRKVLQEDGTWS